MIPGRTRGKPVGHAIKVGTRLLLCLLVTAPIGCSVAPPAPEYTEDRKNLLEHCGVPGLVRRAIEQNMRYPGSFQWFRTVGARPSEESLVWGTANAHGESQFFALVRGFNAEGTLIPSRWSGVIDRDSCTVTSLGEL